MLAPAELSLVQRDPALAALPLLLDNAELGSWLSQRIGRNVAVRRRYLRYKPATSCVVAADVVDFDDPGSLRTVVMTGWARDSFGKFEKSIEKMPPGVPVVVDHGLGLVATHAAGDRHLPALAALADPRGRIDVLTRLLPLDGIDATRVETLSYKPHRRWVGLLRGNDGDPSFVLRAYRLSDVRPAIARARALDGGLPRTPRVLGRRRHLGLVAMEHLPGTTPDATAPHDVLSDVGAMLATLHDSRRGLQARRVIEETAAVSGAARQVTQLLPASTSRVVALVDEVTRRLGGLDGVARDPDVPLHGDFSLDQVVVMPGGKPGLIDLDRAGVGAAAIDLGSAAAVAWTHGGAVDHDRVLTGLTSGYETVRPVPDAGAVAVQAAAQLLRRSGEPFRRCRPDWKTEIEQLLDAVEDCLATAGATR